ncbi:MAG: divergent polysaccharide deacetylase family protein [bacterium]
MKRNKGSRTTLIISIVFSIICIIGVWILRDGILENKSHPNVEVTPEVKGYNDYSNHNAKSKPSEKISEEPKRTPQRIEVTIPKRGEPLSTPFNTREEEIKAFFKDIGAIVKDNWTVEIPSYYSLTWVDRRLSKYLDPLGMYLRDDVVYSKDTQDKLFTLNMKKMSLTQGKVAIIIDDTGRDTSLNNLLKGIKLPLNISVLPKQKKTTEMSLMGELEGWDVLLHLPMEPKEKRWIDGTFIRIGMNEEEIKNKINDFLGELPYVEGVNNHMGSAATQDRRTMKIVLETIKEKNLYFIDSLTIPNSVGEDVAREINFSRFLKRDIFLDNNDDRSYISNQIDKLIMTAKEKGIAIGIGHLRKNTLEVIRDYNWSQSSIELAVLGELFK